MDIDYALPMPAPPEVGRFYWNGCLIEIECEVASRYAWLATETRVTVFGRLIASSGGFNASELASGIFVDPMGQQHTIEVTTFSPPMRYLTRSVGCEVRIDGTMVAAGPLPIRNVDEILIALAGTLAAVVGLYWFW
jgi:hypothetical protein